MRTLFLAAVLLWPCSLRAEPLFEALGGHDGLVRLVDAAAERWLTDPRIAAGFAETSMPRFKRLLVDQLCMVTGGGCPYIGRGMQAAHAGLNLRQRDFNALTEDLQNAMDAMAIPFSTQNRLLSVLAPMQRDVVSR